MSDQQAPTTPSPFHPGEVELQTRVGVADRMAAFGHRVIRDHMPDQHRQFYGQLPFLVTGAVDPAGDAWATLLTGRPGFVTSPDPRHLDIAAAADPADPAAAGLGEGAAVGLLGIELPTRRRNRMNGHVQAAGPSGLRIAVEQAFGNCPQYIQLRDPVFVREPGPNPDAPDAVETDLDDARVRSLVSGADTFFVASYLDDESGRHVDVSHRGGKAGFVRIDADGALTIPDFAGNLHFNTLGNILLNPRAGLLFPDFETGDLLQLTGDAELILDSPEIAAFQGAERLWRFRPRRVLLRPSALPLRLPMRADGWSPNSLMTGDWDQARSRLGAQRLASAWRPFRVARIVEESSVIRSFHLEPADGAGIAVHAAGQHLPIRVIPEGADTPVMRTYTLSTAPSDGFYRISVKRQGLVSAHLHRLNVGDLIEARAPAGGFTLDHHETRPAVLIAAGVGITPILAMLRSILFEGLRSRRIRPTWLFVAARSRTERAFDAEIARLVEASDGAVRLIRVLADTTDSEPGTDYEAMGRIGPELLRAVLPFDAYDFYLCGPTGFMQGLHDHLRDVGVPETRIHAEAFGPAGLQRSPDPSLSPPAAAATGPVPVAFSASGKEARWTPEAGTLLELAEDRALSPAHSCRSGSCGSCAVRLLKGAVAYPVAPSAPIPDGHALLCSAVPAAGEDRLILDV